MSNILKSTKLDVALVKPYFKTICFTLLLPIVDRFAILAAFIASVRLFSTLQISCSLISSEPDPITKHPRPCTFLTKPSCSNSVYAFVTVKTLIFKSLASVLREGKVSSA